MFTLTPGSWYFLFTCENCKSKQVLFSDLSKGKSKITATYVVPCPNCRHPGAYDSEKIERYQHPLDGTERPEACTR